MISVNGEIHSSKNSRRIFRSGGGRPFVTKSRAALSDEQTILLQLITQRGEWERMIVGNTFPLYVAFRFRRQTRARWDFANLVQGVADAMVKAGFIPDDDVGHFIPVYVPHAIDRECPGVDIWVCRQKLSFFGMVYNDEM